MAQGTHIIHHIRETKGEKTHLTHELIEKLAYVAGIANQLFTLPQAFQIWLNKDASGVSLITWITYFIVAIIMTWYGIIHKANQLIMMYSALAVANFMVVLGTIIY